MGDAVEVEKLRALTLPGPNDALHISAGFVLLPTFLNLEEYTQTVVQTSKIDLIN